MGRRQTMMEKYKMQMKAYRKKRGKIDSTPFLPPNGILYIMDTMNPTEKIKAEIVKTRIRSQREVIDTIACPICSNPMQWDPKWEAFACLKHDKKAIYEVVQSK
jgi:hypothetical protein